MLNKILEFRGVQQLNRTQQLSINGGRKQCILPGTTQCSEYGQQCAERQCIFAPF
ncbi:hypothetical protein ACE939_08130 [Aquimarina sp. W85]|uniref:hypothetical protein n=1 Tax=Aquimarina rhodophyticola TaxID=3342246 RepID=UPI00366AAA9D